MSAKQTIERSVSHNEIVTEYPDTDEDFVALCENLSALSDDNIAVSGSYPRVEYWGTTVNGEEWRVHVMRPRS